jgi:hypothetical protein
MEMPVRSDSVGYAEMASGVSWGSIAAGAAAASALTLALLALARRSAAIWPRACGPNGPGCTPTRFFFAIPPTGSSLGRSRPSSVRAYWPLQRPTSSVARQRGSALAPDRPSKPRIRLKSTSTGFYVRIPRPLRTGGPSHHRRRGQGRGDEALDVDHCDEWRTCRRRSNVCCAPHFAADRARKSAVKLAFWLTAYLLFGAFAASLAAVEGGQARDGTWNDRRLALRS